MFGHFVRQRQITAVFTKSYIDKDGKTMHRGVLCLGGLPDIGKDGRNRLASMLTTMVGEGQGRPDKDVTWKMRLADETLRWRGHQYIQKKSDVGNLKVTWQMAAMWVRMQELKTNQSLHSTETLNNKLYPLFVNKNVIAMLLIQFLSSYVIFLLLYW